MLPALAAQDDGGEGEEQRRGHKQQQPEHGEDGEHLEPVQYSKVQYSSDETNNNFRPNTNTNNIRFSKSTEYEYE